jgi:hypothetical protein
VASPKNILPDKRRTTVLISLICLLGIFLIPYFFVFIPSNANNLKRQAFLKLNRAAQNIVGKTNDTRNYYQNTRSGGEQLDSIVMSTAECSSAGKERLSLPDAVYFMFRGSEWKMLFVRDWFPVRTHKNARVYELPLAAFIQPSLAPGKEVFSAFMLVHFCPRIGADSGSSKIIYQDFREGMEQDINMDSLIPRHQGIRSPDMMDISLEGTDYKLFTYPFLLGRHRLVLCGLLKNDVYEAKLHQIPVGTYYTLVIALVIFLLSLPFLKIFMMNERDRLFAINLAVGIVALFILASFIAIISTQLILLTQGRSQVSANLDSLSIKIEDSLSAELTRAQNELMYFDERLSDNLAGNPDTQSIPGTPAFLITFDSSCHDPALTLKQRIYSGHFPLYHNADQVSWISDTGKQLVRAKYLSSRMKAILEMKKGNVDTIPFIDVKQREYYQDLYARFKYRKDNDSALRLAPVQSWASGDFRVNVCRYSCIKGLMVQLLDTKLYSLVNTVLPAGYGFCLFDASGNTLIHSDTVKSLRENFLDEIGRIPWIEGSIKARQGIQAGSVPFYGTQYTLRIQPLKQHPLFLAVFYNNDFLEPVIIRILSFSLFFGFMTYILLYVLFLALYRRENETCLYSPMEYNRRIVPSRDKFRLYFNGSVLMLVYIAFFSIGAIFSPTIGHDVDYTVLVIGLLTPFTGLYSLWLLQHYMGKLSFKKSLRYILPVFFTGGLIFIMSRIAGWAPEPVSFFSALLLECLLLSGVIINKGNCWTHFWRSVKAPVVWLSGWDKKSVEEKKLFSYSVFVSLFIFSVAVLPVLEYSWFAYIHELRQSVKKEQLEIADGLQKRERTVRAFLHINQPNFTGDDSNFRVIQYKNGVYPVYTDRIYSYKDADFSTHVWNEDHDAHAESFYLGISTAINSSYKDPAGLPPLYDSALQDNLYHWHLNRDSSEFDYSRARWKVPLMLEDTRPADVNFKIISLIPGGLEIDTRLKLVFSGMIFALLLSLYWIIKTMARQIYLTKIIGDAVSGLDDRYANAVNEFWESCITENKKNISATYLPELKGEITAALLLKDLKEEYVRFDKKEEDLVILESDFISKSETLGKLFECVWSKMDDKEKYLLYCLANDGLLNHKNKPVIYALLNKNMLVIYEQRIRLISYSFREFIISRNNTNDEIILLAAMKSGASWANMRTIVVVVIISVFIFLFLTQQEVSAKIIALVTSLTALLPFVLKLGSSTPAAAENKN